MAEAVPDPVTAAIEQVCVHTAPGAQAALAGADDSWFSPGAVKRAARLVVAAWVSAVDGDGARLRALAGPARADDGDVTGDPLRRELLFGPGPRVTGIDVRRLSLDGHGPEMTVEWRFSGSQRYPARPGWAGSTYVGSAYLAFDVSRPFPWRVSGVRVRDTDEYHGYTYAARDETRAEYRARTGVDPDPAVLVPGTTYRLLAQYREYGHAAAGNVTTDVRRAVPLAAAEARPLAQDAIEQDVRSGLVPLYSRDDVQFVDVDTSLTLLRVIRQLEVTPAARPAVRYSVGRADSYRGYSELLIRPDGSARLDEDFAPGRYFDQRPRAWAGQVDATVLDQLLAALGQTGFPPAAPGGPAALRRVRLEANGAVRQLVTGVDKPALPPGYARIFDVIDAVVEQLSGNEGRYPTRYAGRVVYEVSSVPFERRAPA